MFRSGKEKTLFIISVALIFFLFTLAMLLINSSYALPISTEIENQVTLDLEEVAIEKPTKSEVVLAQVKQPAYLDQKDLKNFGLIVQQGQIFPQIINLELNDQVRLDVVALDNDYHFELADFNISEALSQGETKSIILKADKLGSFNCNSYNQDKLLGSGEIIISN